MISIVAVNFNSPEFADLLVDSVERTKSEEIEIIIPDNSYKVSYKRKGVITFDVGLDHTHGSGLNSGLKKVKTDEVLILDIDCHLLCRGWEEAFRNKLELNHCVTVPGPPEKPLRPACCFMKSNDARYYDWRSTPGYKGHRVTPEGYDVGIIAYHQMKSQDHSVYFMESTRNNRYGTVIGEEYGIDGNMLVYHQWHATHTEFRQVDYEIDLNEEKKILFANIPWKKKAKLL